MTRATASRTAGNMPRIPVWNSRDSSSDQEMIELQVESGTYREIR